MNAFLHAKAAYKIICGLIARRAVIAIRSIFRNLDFVFFSAHVFLTYTLHMPPYWCIENYKNMVMTQRILPVMKDFLRHFRKN